jgi:uncharacterized membrane protein
MWIGNSMLFNWLDRNLEALADPAARPGLIGDIWMVHSGGFYQVEKKFLAPSQMPRTLHWFKWQNGITWMSGIALLVLVYYMGGAALMADPAVSTVSAGTSVAIGVGAIVASFVLYDLVWRSALGRSPTLGFVLSVVIVAGASAVLFRFMSGRAAYMHVGVMLGTIMTGNVWTVIIPSQREMVNATKEGREQDPSIGYQAKQRSIHNNYMTFPLLFIMLSNHFPSTFGHLWNWVVLLVLTVGSAGIRHLMNVRFTYRRWLPVASLVFFVACASMWVLIAFPQGFTVEKGTITRPVTFAQAQAIVVERCVSCHSAKPSNPAFATPPQGITLETPEQIKRLAARIRYRVATVKNMPLANLTNMTDEERAVVGAWVDQGAKGP